MAPPALGEAWRVWLRIGLISFGGPAGQIALMHRLLVQERGWISESRFLHALNYCMLLPGPEAQQLATYIGWLMHRTAGGLIAGTLFVMPGLLLMLGMAATYLAYGERPWLGGLLLGLQVATVAIVIEAVLRLSRRVLGHPLRLGLALAAFVAIFALALPFPLVIGAAAGLGWAGSRWWPAAFPAPAPSADDTAAAAADPGWTVRVLLSGAVLWGLPVLLLVIGLGMEHVYAEQAVFFSKVALVGFGGAYAVLTYLTQQAVQRYGWLGPDEMVQGLGLAETTPGPLILVLSFVGFVAAYREPGVLPPGWAGLFGGLLSAWVTFVPCFLWIFLGAPYVERVRQHAGLAAALSGVSSAVVGVILSLGVWFGLHTFFADVGTARFGALGVPWPVPGSVRVDASCLGALAVLALFLLRWPIPAVLAVCGAGGLLLGVFNGAS